MTKFPIQQFNFFFKMLSSNYIGSNYFGLNLLLNKVQLSFEPYGQQSNSNAVTPYPYT